jgi:hypothetical protein
MVRKVLLVCGILSSLLYVATVVLAAIRWEGYSSTSQTVSELIAIDAPTTPLVVPLFVIYSLLVYAIATILILLVFGILAGLDGSRLAANLPTPWMGVWERINIFGYMLWVVVLTIVLLRVQDTVAPDDSGGRSNFGSVGS